MGHRSARQGPRGHQRHRLDSRAGEAGKKTARFVVGRGQPIRHGRAAGEKVLSKMLERRRLREKGVRFVKESDDANTRYT
jgi:hypothetical protein